MPKRCTSCSSRAETGKLKCPFHLAMQNWDTKRSYYRTNGRDEALAGPKPEASDFTFEPFAAGGRVKRECDEKTEGRERIEFAKSGAVERTGFEVARSEESLIPLKKFAIPTQVSATPAPQITVEKVETPALPSNGTYVAEAPAAPPEEPKPLVINVEGKVRAKLAVVHAKRKILEVELRELGFLEAFLADLLAPTEAA